MPNTRSGISEGTPMLSVIKTKADYERILAEIEELIIQDPELGTPEGNRMEILVLLVQDYERRTYDFLTPDPIEAILFRMEQANLTPRDLVPYIGSRSKVSEVLARKRPLTLSMIRALHEGIGIPAAVLLAESKQPVVHEEMIEWNRFPVKEMIKRGWLKPTNSDKIDRPENLLRPFFSSVSALNPVPALSRNTEHIRSGRKVDEFALQAWMVQVIRRAQEDRPPVKFIPGSVNLEFMKELAQLSWSEMGPRLAQEYLNKHGISLVIEPQLRGTQLDGAAIMIYPDHPVIGLTLRYDRIDNFWFTLEHEIAHVALHTEGPTHQFFDDLDVESEDPREQQADELASEALIPKEAWLASPASTLRSQKAAEQLAQQLRIHPAIVAGRMRRTFNSYRILNKLVGHKQVRRCFAEIDWGKEV